MIDHTGIQVSDIAKSRAFYLQALAPLGYAIRLEFDGAVGFGPAEPGAGEDPGGDFWISSGTPFVPRSHIAFRADDETAVTAFFAAAIAAGGRSNGEPGPRPQYHEGYFAAFVLDPDGYNIEAVHHG
ncbi:VOC family protein [Niveibacterium terrae]|uniref:VOC family protein n=1 Tax=Niveibacterium terrae TaxID=3373598 RepID=UPI003A90F5F3